MHILETQWTLLLLSDVGHLTQDFCPVTDKLFRLMKYNRQLEGEQRLNIPTCCI